MFGKRLKGIIRAFGLVSDDVNSLGKNANETNASMKRMDGRISRLENDKKKLIVKGEITGNRYLTTSGKLKALAEHLGVDFGIRLEEIIPSKPIVVKKTTAKKGKK